MAQDDGKRDPAKEKAHLLQLLRGYRTGMLTTLDAGKMFHSRPMHVARVDDDCSMWFMTSTESGKAEEIEADPRVAVTLHSSAADVALAGDAGLVRDREKIREMWSEAWRVWFPDGPEQADLVLVKVLPDHAEYWDRSGGKGVRYLLRAVRAYATGTRPGDLPPKEHGFVPKI